MTILHYIFVALEVVLLFNLLIGVHELGHFLAAKWRGLKIERFAIWFGKPIWCKKIGGIEYALGWIPAGGYVSLPQMASMEMIEGKSETSSKQTTDAASLRSGDLVSLDAAVNVSPLDKIIVAFAGPLFSFGLAVVFACIVWGVGKPENKADDTTVVGWVDPAGPAGLAGLQPGDKIIAVDGHPVKNFMPSGALADSIKWRIITSTGTNIPITYLRDNQVLKAFPVPTNLPTKWYERKSLRQISFSPAEKIMIGEIASNSPAALAGLKPGDEVVRMNGQKVYSFISVLSAQDAISNNPTKAITLSLKRGGEQFDRSLLAIKPLQPTNVPPLLGIMSWYGDTNITIQHPNPVEQISASAAQIFSTIGALFEPKGQVSVQQLGGAVMIGRVYYSLFQDDEGYRRVLWFSVILNVNLALLNLLPLPVLDGGHITLSLIEVIRRRPVSARVMNAIQSGFAILLIGFMVYIAFFDTGDWIRSARANREEHVMFAPANANPAAPAPVVEHGQQITIPPAK